MARERSVYQVADLNRSVKHVLETNLSNIWVEGEASNVVVPYSGHVYFTLKDENAQVRCVCFRGQVARLGVEIEDGAQLLVNARVTMYEARGDYQLLITAAEHAGVGALQRAFVALKKKLQNLGWFDEKYKQPIPTMPKTVGVITSATGAAVRDVLRVLYRRFPAINVIIYPSMVQGTTAPAQLIRALDIANERDECDVLLLVRGGGSIEDLWAFNDAELAEAIFHSRIPIVSGVGHEIDFTISDFVADMRAATPSAAAECVSPDQVELFANLMTLQAHMQKIIEMRLHKMQLQLEKTVQRLVHPGERIKAYQIKAAKLQARLISVTLAKLNKNKYQMVATSARLQALDLTAMLRVYRNALQQSLYKCRSLVAMKMKESQNNFAQVVKALELLNPLAVLVRGYAIVQSNGKVVKSSSDVKIGDDLTIRVAEGELHAVVK